MLQRSSFSSAKKLPRALKAFQWVQKLAPRVSSPTVFVFYGLSSLTPSNLLLLFQCYGAAGFSWSLQGRSWASWFWPKGHRAYSFLRQGNLYCLSWPSITLFQEACDAFPSLLQNYRCGLTAGHFFFFTRSLTKIFFPDAEASKYLCHGLFAHWSTLLENLSFLVAQLIFMWPTHQFSSHL